MRKTCPVCLSDFDTNREKATYCGNPCKMRAYRSRHGIETKDAPQYTICQRSTCEKPIPEGGRADTKYCSSYCRKKVTNDKAATRVKDERDKAKAVEDFIQELMK